MAIDSSERLVNLALYLSRDRSFSTIEDIRSGVEGYDRDGSTDAFARMFEHDKDNLRAAGLTIEVDESTQGYRIDPSLSFASEVTFEPREAAMIRAVGGLMLADPDFPLRSDLQLALAKIGSSLGGIDALAKSASTDAPGRSTGDPRVAVLEDAINRSKFVTFTYEKPDGSTSERTLDPYGLTRYSGAWYVVGYDRTREAIRMFKVDRASDVALNTRQPKSVDFDRPADFDVADYLGFEFQFGSEEPYTAHLTVDSGAARTLWRRMQRSGEVTQNEDGSLDWTVDVNDTDALVRWAIGNGPGVTLVDPPMAVGALAAALNRVEVTHGSSELG